MLKIMFEFWSPDLKTRNSSPKLCTCTAQYHGDDGKFQISGDSENVWGLITVKKLVKTQYTCFADFWTHFELKLFTKEIFLSQTVHTTHYHGGECKFLISGDSENVWGVIAVKELVKSHVHAWIFFGQIWSWNFFTNKTVLFQTVNTVWYHGDDCKFQFQELFNSVERFL